MSVLVWVVALILFVLGLLSVLFLKTYVAVILGCVALCLIILLLAIVNGYSTNGTSGGLGFLLLAAIPAIFIEGQFVGAGVLFVLSWGDIIGWLNQAGDHAPQFMKEYILR